MQEDKEKSEALLSLSCDHKKTSARLKNVFIYANNVLDHTRKGNMLLCVVKMCEVFVKLFMIAVIVET